VRHAGARRSRRARGRDLPRPSRGYAPALGDGERETCGNRRKARGAVMIAALAGRVDVVASDHAVIDVSGVGYLVFASGRTLARLPEPGGSAKLLIETHVREDHIHLYGFADAAERGWFRLLTTVQGVGARTAMAILSALAPEDLTLAVAAQDKAV